MDRTKAGTRGMRVAWLAALFARATRPIMIRSHRRRGDTFRGKAVLYLTTTGAKTGKRRKTPVGYEPDGEGAWLVVASFGGTAQHPGWYHNIVAHPEQVWIEVGGRHHRVRPQQLDGPRRDEAWRRITAGNTRVYDHVTPAMLRMILDVLDARWTSSLIVLTRAEQAQLAGWFPYLRTVFDDLRTGELWRSTTFPRVMAWISESRIMACTHETADQAVPYGNGLVRACP